MTLSQAAGEIEEKLMTIAKGWAAGSPPAFDLPSESLRSYSQQYPSITYMNCSPFVEFDRDRDVSVILIQRRPNKQMVYNTKKV